MTVSTACGHIQTRGRLSSFTCDNKGLHDGIARLACQCSQTPACSEWDNRSQSKRSLMAVALPATLAILVASVALGGACLYSQKQLQSLPRARQSPSDWLEESGAKNQVSGVNAVREAATKTTTTECKSVYKVTSHLQAAAANTARLKRATSGADSMTTASGAPADPVVEVGPAGPSCGVQTGGRRRCEGQALQVSKSL